MTPKLLIEHLSKSFGSFQAVDDISLQVQPGCVFGLLGRNGAGKTTAFSCALGLARANQGRVFYDGRELTPETLETIAYVPETPALYGWMTAAQHIEMQRRLYRRFDLVRARELTELFELPLKKRVRSLSKGQKTAVALMLAFSQQAEVLFLDEPSSGLDPLMQRRLLDLIVQAGADGITVIFSSHQIGQIERAAETIAIMDRGKIALMSNLDELRTSRKLIEARFTTVPKPNGLLTHAGVLTVEVYDNVLEVRTEGQVNSVVAAIEAMQPASLRVVDQSLEDVFLRTISTTTKEVR